MEDKTELTEVVLQSPDVKLPVINENLQNDEKEKTQPKNETPVQIQQKPKPAKPKKRKKLKDSTAPRHPLTGYVRYLNDRRESVRTENPTLPFSEITKVLASEWSKLPVDKKQYYLDAAEQDRERYTREYNEYKQTDAYKQFMQQQNEKKQKKEEEARMITQPLPPPVIPKESHTNNNTNFNNNNDLDFSNFDIPIFTEEFLEHNKTRDAELRQLRKSNTDYEQQNAILQKHIENMKMAIEKLEEEILQQKKNNASLQQHLEHVRVTLSNGFASVKLPGIKEVATLQNIDNYMTNLHSILLENSSNDVSLLQTVRNIVAKLEFSG